MQQPSAKRKSTPRSTNKQYVIAFEDENDADWDVVGDAPVSFSEAVKAYEVTRDKIIERLNKEHAEDTEHVESVPKTSIYLLSFPNNKADFDGDDVWNKVEDKQYHRIWSAQREVNLATNCRRGKLPLMMVTLRYAYALEIIQERLMKGI